MIKITWAFILHSTPLAPSLPSQGSWRGPGVRGEAFLHFSLFGRLRLEMKFKIET